VTGRVFGVAGALVGAGVVAALILFFVVAKHYRMPSSSMEPTLHCAKPAPGCEASHEDRFIVFTFLGWGRDDVVAFHTPPAALRVCGAGGVFVKRVIDGPGDTVREDAGGFLWVNGKKLDETYVQTFRRRQDVEFRDHTWRVPQDEWFMVGDNRGESCDSRKWGPVASDAVIGRVFMTYWPLGRLHFW
jgi:signal peptidase I